MIGLRFHVGGDWSTYEDMYSDIALQPLGEAVRFTDPYALNWLPAKVDGGVYIPNLVCRRVHAGALVRRQPKPWLAMTMPSLIS